MRPHSCTPAGPLGVRERQTDEGGRRQDTAPDEGDRGPGRDERRATAPPRRSRHRLIGLLHSTANFMDTLPPDEDPQASAQGPPAGPEPDAQT